MKFFTGFLVVLIPWIAFSYSIDSYNCTSKDNIWWDRSKTGSAGSSCGCPCKGAKYMGIDGRSHKSQSGNIRYKFTAESGTYTVKFIGKKDNECATSYTIDFGSKKVSGSVSKGSGEETDTYTNISISQNATITVWAKSCFPSGVDHGSYNRWRTMQFTKTGGGTDPNPDPDPDPDTTDPPAQVTGFKATNTTSSTITLSWSASANTASYDIYWTTTNENNPDDNTTKTSYTITGLTPNTEYSIWIKAKGSDGTRSKGTNVTARTQSATGIAPSVRNGAATFRATVAGTVIDNVVKGDNIALFTLDGSLIVKKNVLSRGEVLTRSLKPGTYLLKHTSATGELSVSTISVEATR